MLRILFHRVRLPLHIRLTCFLFLLSFTALGLGGLTGCYLGRMSAKRGTMIHPKTDEHREFRRLWALAQRA